jgi:hypothetical protein
LLLLQEVVASRRNFNVKEKIFTPLFLEELTATGEGADMDDNVKPKIKVEAKDQVVKLLKW